MSKDRPLRIRARYTVGDAVKHTAFQNERTYVGSNVDSTLCFQFAGLQGRHVVFKRTPFGLVLRKRNPHHRVSVNDELLHTSQHTIHEGDVVKMSQVVFEFLEAETRKAVDAEVMHEGRWTFLVDLHGSHLTPHTERVGDSLLTRLEFFCGETFGATLKLSGPIRKGVIELIAQIPPGQPSACIQKQRRFLVGFFQTLGELEIDNKEVDDAFYIDAPHTSLELIKALAIPLRAFVDVDVDIEIEDQKLTIRTVSESSTAEILKPLFALWTTLCEYHAGNHSTS